MTTVSMTELRRCITKVLNLVVYHHRFFKITRNGRPVAMVVPYSKKWEEIEKASQLPEEENPVVAELEE